MEGFGGGRTDGDDAGAEFDADGYVVMGSKAAFAETDCELVDCKSMYPGKR